jgi:hypothetical protein
MLRNAVPWEYGQHLFRHYIEPTILKEINKNKPQRFEDQATYFLSLVDLAVKLPPAVRPCIEALTHLYLAIFYISRGYHNESEIAFTRMNELVLEHDLLYVELAYLLHTTFSAGPLLYPSAGDLTRACVETALRLIARLPDSQFILDDYSRQFTVMWVNKITFPPDTPLLEGKNRLTERIQDFANAILDVSERFFHVCAVLLLWIQETELWVDDALALHQEILPRPLEYLKIDDLFKLYDEFGVKIRAEAQSYILVDGNVERGQKLSAILYDVITSAIERYRDRFSLTQLTRLQEHQYIAKLWLG